jgi:thiamine kinase-like enzyme
MDDVTVTRDARVDTILTRQMTRELAEDMVDLLARLHATFWADPTLTSTYPWLMDPIAWQERIDRLMLMKRNVAVGFERARHVMPSEIYARRTDFPAALHRCREISAAGPRTLVHTDVHAGNWYVTGDGRMGLFDWQCMLNSLGVQDLTYAVIGNLTVEDRRSWEHDLVMRYGEQLAEGKVANVSGWEQLWLLYRQMVPYAMFMWLGTIGANRMQPEMQKPEISLANLARSSQACADLDTFAALGL